VIINREKKTYAKRLESTGHEREKSRERGSSGINSKHANKIGEGGNETRLSLPKTKSNGQEPSTGKKGEETKGHIPGGNHQEAVRGLRVRQEWIVKVTNRKRQKSDAKKEGKHIYGKTGGTSGLLK